MQRSVSLPQFKDERIKCGPRCGIRHKCRHPAYADWREAQTGMREFACPFDKPVIKESLTTEPTGIRGLGDVVAAVTSAVGIKPCGGCKKRQEALNKAVPFKSNPTT